MPKNISKIYKHSAFLMLAIIIYGLFNICLFAFQARAIQSIPPPQLNFTPLEKKPLTKSEVYILVAVGGLKPPTSDTFLTGFTYDNSGNCVTEPILESAQTINYPTAPMLECCLTQNRNFNALVNTANNKSAPAFTSLIILSSENLNSENNSTYNTSQTIFPPPAALALASTVIRE